MRHIKKILIILILIIISSFILSSCTRSPEEKKYAYSLYTDDTEISLEYENILIGETESDSSSNDVKINYNFHIASDKTVIFYLPYLYNKDKKLSDTELIFNTEIIEPKLYTNFKEEVDYSQYSANNYNYDYFVSSINVDDNANDIIGYCYIINFDYTDSKYLDITFDSENNKLITSNIEELHNSLYRCRYRDDEMTSIFVIGEDINNIKFDGVDHPEWYTRIETTLLDYVKTADSSYYYNYEDLFVAQILLDFLNSDDYRYELDNFPKSLEIFDLPYDCYYYCILAYEVNLAGEQSDNFIELNYKIDEAYSDKYHSYVYDYNFLTSPADKYLNKGVSDISVDLQDEPYLIYSNINLLKNDLIYEGEFDSSISLVTFQLSSNSNPETFDEYNARYEAEINSFFTSIKILVFIIKISPIILLFLVIILIIFKKLIKKKKLKEAIEKYGTPDIK